MNSKKSSRNHERNLKNFGNSREYSTLADLMKEQGVSTNLADYWEKKCESNPSNQNA